jgi:hypothetical protein
MLGHERDWKSNIVVLKISTGINTTEDDPLLLKALRALVVVGHMTGSSAVLVDRVIVHH